MSIVEAQRDVRRVYAGGFHGQPVSAVVWLAAAAAAQWVDTGSSVLVLLLGGTVIFPLTCLVIRLAGRPASLPSGHPMAALAMQVAFTVPIGLLVVVALLAGRGELFLPGSMEVVGAHYPPFVFLYGMRMFAFLSVALVVPGLTFLIWVSVPPPFAGWFTSALLVVFAVLLRSSADHLDAGERTPSP